MGLEVHAHLGAAFDRLRHLEDKMRQLEQGIPASYAAPASGFRGVMGVLLADLDPGDSASIRCQDEAGDDLVPEQTQLVYLPDSTDMATVPSGSFVYAFGGFVGAKGRYTVFSAVCGPV